MMDQNESVTQNTGFTQDLEINHSMHNIAKLHGLQKIPTYKRSHNQMDAIMVSTGLQQYIHAYDMHPFDHICPSDHRSMHLDIDLSSYYKETKQLQKYIPRGITSTNTRNLKKYKQTVYDLLHSPSMKSAIDSIKTKLKSNTLTIHDRETINMIDAEFIQIRENAQKKIQQNQNKNAPWSPPLAQAYLQVQLWTAIKKAIMMKRDMTERIDNIQEKLKEPLALIPTSESQIKEVNTQLTSAKANYKEMQKQAPELRNRHLWDQANAAEISGNKKASKEIKQLLYIENSRQKHRKVDYYFKEKLDCSMDTIKIETKKME